MKLTISIKGTSDGNNEKSNDFRNFLTHPCDREGKISLEITSVKIFMLAYWITVGPIDSIFVRLHLLSQQHVIFCYECITILVPNNFHKERTC